MKCNRLKCPRFRLSVLQCYDMGHNGHGINLYGVIMTLIGNLHAGGQCNLGHLSLSHWPTIHTPLSIVRHPVHKSHGGGNI